MSGSSSLSDVRHNELDARPQVLDFGDLDENDDGVEPLVQSAHAAPLLPIADEPFPHVGDKVAGRYYLFTCMPTSIVGRKQPAEIGRQGLYESVSRAYGAVFPSDHPCHHGPDFGAVALEPSMQEHGDASGEAARPHLHAALQFSRDHKWKAVEKQLREVQGIKVGSMTLGGLL